MKQSTELRQQRAALYEQAKAFGPPDTGEWPSENRTKFQAMMTEMDTLKGTIDSIEAYENIGASLRSAVGSQPTTVPVGGSPLAPPPTSGFGGDDLDPRVVEQQRLQQRQYAKVFDRYLRRGLPGLQNDEINLLRSLGRSAEYRDQDNTTGPGGGYTIPQGFQAELEVALKAYGGMRQGARIITTTTGATLPWPTTNDTAVKGRRLGANAVTNAAAVSNQTFGQVVFQSYTYTSDEIRIPNELLNDSAFDLAGEVRDRFTERIGRIQNTEFTTYNGSGGPTGILNSATVGVTGAAGDTAILGDDFIKLEHSLDPAYRNGASYMLNDATLLVARLLKDNQGRYLFGAGLNDGDPDRLNGYPFIINQDFPTPAASAKCLAFGRFSKYIIRDVLNSAVVIRLQEMYAQNNETAFLAFLRSDGQLVDAGTHPVVLFQAAAS